VVYERHHAKEASMHRALLGLTAVLTLALPAVASAKEISKLEVCGAGDCNSTSDRALLAHIGEGSDGGTPGSTPALQPFYKLTYTVSAGPGERFNNGRTSETFSTYYVPGARETRGFDERGNASWLPASQVFVSALRRLTRGLEAFAAPRITAVTLDGRPVADPASYARLLTIRGSDAGFVDAVDWQAVEFRSKQPSPWTTETIPMLFSPETGVLARDGGYVKLPGDVAAAVRDYEAVPAAGGGSGFPAWAYGFIAVAWAGIAAAIVLLLRRPPKGGPRSVAEPA
jgi:hypothetical protein